MRPRRRATRGSAAPVTPPEATAPEVTASEVTASETASSDAAPSEATSPEATSPASSAETAPVAESAEVPAPVEAIPAGDASGPEATEQQATEQQEAPPKRRSRRATKAAGAAENVRTAGRRKPATAAGSGAFEDVAADAAAGDAVVAGAATAETGSGTAEAPPEPARPERARRGRTAPDEPASGEPAASTAPSTQEPASRTRTARRTRAASSGTTPDAGDGGRAEKKDDKPRTAPRLATTALLFQAPDLTAVQRARREPELTMAGAGTTVSDTATKDVDTSETVAEPESAESSAPAGSRSSTRSAAGKRAPGGAEAPSRKPAGSAGENDAAGVADEAVPAPRFQTAELSADDAAAVDEVGVIEEELAAEGVELTELAPADLDEDEEFEDDGRSGNRRRRRRGGRGRRGGRTRDDRGDDEPGEQGKGDEQADDTSAEEEPSDTHEDVADDDAEPGSRRRRRRRRGNRAERAEAARSSRGSSDEVTALKGSTRLEAKRQRRREGRDAGRRRQIVTEAEFLARRESVTRSMVVREQDGRTQIAVLEDGVLVEHYVSQQSQVSMAGNVYLGRVQNVLPSMEAAFVDIGKGRNAVLYAGEVNWDAAGIADGQPRRIEEALKSGDTVLVQVTKDPIGHKGARLTSQVTLAGRYLVFVPGGGMTGISRKLPDTERNRLKKILREVVPEGAGVIVRTAAEGASEDELRADVERLQGQWNAITTKADRSKKSAPVLLQGEPDLAIRVVRDIFNDDFSSLVVAGDRAWDEISSYVDELAPDLRERVTKWVQAGDVFAEHRIDEQLAKGMDRKVWLPSGGSLVIDRTEAMTVVDVNTGKFTGAGGTLEETVTRNNLEAAEEIVRQLRLRDIGGIIVIDFIDMVLESNRDLVLRRLVECLGRDRTKHQVAEVTSLGLVQMTRKRVGQGLVEAFSETCEHCNGRGFVVHDHPVERGPSGGEQSDGGSGGSARKRRKRGGKSGGGPEVAAPPKSAGPASPAAAVLPEESSEQREEVKARLATIAAAAQHAHEGEGEEAKDATDLAAGADHAPRADQDTDAVPAAEPEPAPRSEHRFEISLPEPRSGAGERATTMPAASLDAIVLPDRSLKAEPAAVPANGSAGDTGEQAEDGTPDGGDASEPAKGAGDEVA
nr:Rne/Rng family ribonuclease [Myceligenerans indicum]